MKPPVSPSVVRRSLLIRALGLVWVVAFVVWFFSFELPNNKYADGSLIPRTDLWGILADLLLANVASTPEPGTPPSGWRFFPQRFDLLAVASAILAGAWGAGHLALRLIGVRKDLDAAEQTVFAFGVGLSALSLMTMLFGVAGLLNRWVFVAIIVSFIAGEAWLRLHERRLSDGGANPQAKDHRPREFSVLLCVTVATVAPFVLAMLLGAMLPSTDFDVKEYHLQGPKEYFQQGRVTFLPHNVYTSFPFLTEMLSLLGMVLRDDWYRGALAGKAVLMSFAPLTALGLFAAGRRWFSPTAGWMAALVYLTTPWAYRISIIAYTEGGLAFFLFASLLAVMLCASSTGIKSPLGMIFLAGLLSGSAVACKYPGVLSVAIPLGAAIVALAAFPLLWPVSRPSHLRPTAGLPDVPETFGRSVGGVGRPAPNRVGVGRPAPNRGGRAGRAARDGDQLADPAQRELRPPAARAATSLKTAAVFLAGTLVTFGPWMLKNLAETGNPVYPLLYTVFGGADWNDAMNAKWRNGHSPPVSLLHEPSRIPGDFAAHVVDVVAKSDWQSPLVFAFAPLALFWRERRKLVLALWTYVLWIFVTWWGLTHRIDRFWVPMLPVVCLLSGIGIGWLVRGMSEILDATPANRSSGSRVRLALMGQLGVVAVTSVVLGAAVLFNLGFVTSPLSGYNAYLINLDDAAKQSATPSIRLLNELPLPEDARVLFVGEAQVFDARFDHVYNTVFDESIFQRWTSAAEPGVPDAEQPLRPADDIRATFAEQGITHVFVNWNEIARYRAPGSYGYTEFVTRERFDDLVAAGVLREVPIDPRWGFQLFTVE